MRIQLTHKFADAIDGIDLSNHRVDDVFDLPLHDAEMLIAEGWALPVASNGGDVSRWVDRADENPARDTATVEDRDNAVKS